MQVAILKMEEILLLIWAHPILFRARVRILLQMEIRIKYTQAMLRHKVLRQPQEVLTKKFGLAMLSKHVKPLMVQKHILVVQAMVTQ